METLNDLIAALGGPSQLARICGAAGASTGTEMKRRQSIPVTHWPNVIAAAKLLRLRGVDAELLMNLHVKRNGHGGSA